MQNDEVRPRPDSDRIGVRFVVGWCREGILMRPLWKDLLAAMFLGLVLPGIVLNLIQMLLTGQEPARQETVPETISETIPEGPGLCMYLQNPDGAVAEMELDRYLTGVLLAEVPAEFEPEALKAQAVAARTYTRKAYTTGGKHGNGSVCTNASCCQGYLSDESYLSLGGSREGLEKIRSAVLATSDQVLTYEGELIEATYFSCSGGWTEDAVAVWGSDFPYLQAVESPGEEKAAHFTDTLTLSPEEFQALLGISLTGDPVGWFGEVTHTDGGGVATMEIGGAEYTGTWLRSLLKLNSTCFTVAAGEQITITTRGYGHRVGMSQYGADAMAVAGSTYDAILSHYYPGTAITALTD